MTETTDPWLLGIDRRTTTPTALCSHAAKGDEYVSLTDPVPDLSWIKLDDGDGWEIVPVYACFGDGPHMAWLGVPCDSEPDGILRVGLRMAHCAGSVVQVQGRQG